MLERHYGTLICRGGEGIADRLDALDAQAEERRGLACEVWALVGDGGPVMRSR
jgi:hypothetical protein